MSRTIVPINTIATVRLIDVKYANYPVYFMEFPIRRNKTVKYRVTYEGDTTGFYDSDGKSLEEGRFLPDTLDQYVNEDNGFTSPWHMHEHYDSLEDWTFILRYYINDRANTHHYNYRLNRTVYSIYRWLTDKCSTDKGYAELFPDRTIEKLGYNEEQLIVERMNRVTMWWSGVKEHLPKAGLYEYNFLLTEALGIPLPKRFQKALKIFLNKSSRLRI